MAICHGRRRPGRSVRYRRGKRRPGLRSGGVGYLCQVYGGSEPVVDLADTVDARSVRRGTGRPVFDERLGVVGAGCVQGATVPGKRLAISTGLPGRRSEEHTSELQSLMRISYAVFCLKKKIRNT